MKRSFGRIFLAAVITAFAASLIDLMVSLIETFFFNQPFSTAVIIKDSILVTLVIITGTLTLFLFWRKA